MPAIHHAFHIVQVALGGVVLDPLGVLADVEGCNQIENDGDNNPHPDAGVEVQTGNLLGHGGGGMERAHAEANADAQQSPQWRHSPG